MSEPDSIRASFRLAWPGFALDVDLTLPGRGISALFGPSGSGKTTLLRCLAGLERARGKLSVAGETWQDDDRWLPAHRRPIGYVFQENRLFPQLSVLGNLRYGMRRSDGGKRIDIDHVVELLGIGHLLDRKPERLSGGEKSRVGIARALAVGPRLLLMDEPLAALDQPRKEEILPYLERLHDELDIPLIYVSHSADEVARLADHLVLMENGRALAAGPLGETLARLDLPIRLGEDAGVVIDTRVGARDEAWHLMRIDFSGGSLWTRDDGLPLGHAARVRILARDVSLALRPGEDSSIANVLPARIVDIAPEAHPATALVRLDAGGAPLIARLTRRSAERLGLRPGLPVWAQIKAVALLG